MAWLSYRLFLQSSSDRSHRSTTYLRIFSSLKTKLIHWELRPRQPKCSPYDDILLAKTKAWCSPPPPPLAWQRWQIERMCDVTGIDIFYNHLLTIYRLPSLFVFQHSSAASVTWKRTRFIWQPRRAHSNQVSKFMRKRGNLTTTTACRAKYMESD